MKFITQENVGLPEVLKVAECPIPVPNDHQLLVEVQAIGMNRADLAQREGSYPAPKNASPILGLEIAGIVRSAPSESGFKEGDEVFGLVDGGGYAEYALLNCDRAIRKPETMWFEEAVCLPEAWMTAWWNLVSLGGLQSGERVLIRAGASGVGSIAIQLAKQLGAEVVVTVRSDAKVAHCQDLGADEVIVCPEGVALDNWPKPIAGWDVVLDPVGGESLAWVLRHLNADGRVMLIGLMAGRYAQLDLGRCVMNRWRIQGSTLRPQSDAIKAMLSQTILTHALPAWQSGKLELRMDKIFSLEDVAAAHDYMHSNQSSGKLVLVP